MEKLKVLYDAEILENSLTHNTSRTGIFFVSYNIVKYLLLDNRITLSIYCRHEIKKRIIKYFQDEYDCDIQKRIFNEGDDLSHINIFLSTVFTPPEYIKRFPQITCFTVIHDVTPLLFPQYFGANAHNSWFDELIKEINKNDFYFAVSEYTKQDFIKYVPAIDDQKITVIQLAADDRFYPNKGNVKLQKVRDKYKIPLGKKYIFSLCTLEERKNLIRAVSAFISFIEKNNIEDLVYVLGGGTWDIFIGRLEKDVPNYHKYADRIIQAGYVADEDLAILLSNAEWFVYTSQYEGFGMPPLEAMQCGCPIVVSNNSSLPEVVGNAGIMIDYDSVEQHIQAYESYYYDSKLREQNAQAGLSQASHFSWTKCVNTIINKITEVEQSKQQKPLVTVITVIHDLNNKKSSIQQCLKSVHQQTYPNIEHIIINNSSNDDTIKYLNEYVDKGWIKLYSESNNGIYDAMNKGIEKAYGTYINFLNPNDFFHNEKGIEISVEYLMKCKADYSFANTLLIQKNGKKNIVRGDIHKLSLAEHFHYSTMLIKTALLIDINGFDTSYHISADSDLMIRLYAKGYKYTQVPFCFLTHKSDSFSKKDWEQYRIEHSTSFFHHIGSHIGLTPDDCFLLWKQRFFGEVYLDKQLNLIGKVPIEFGSEFLMKQLIERSPLEKKNNSNKLQTYLFGCIPLINRKSRKNKTYYYLFDIMRIMKIVDYGYKRKYYLFSIFPIWKIKIIYQQP